MEVPVYKPENKAKVKLRLQIEDIFNNKLRIRLTNPNDHLFYYALTLTEADFHTLRSSQGLTVDFAGFARTIRDLTRKCVEEEAKNPDSPKFKLVLDESECAALDFIEISSFKNLSYLRLKVCRGSDGQIKEYLAERLEKLTLSSAEYENRTKDKNSGLETDLKRTKFELNEKCRILEDLSKMDKERRSEFQCKMSEELAAEKKANAEALSELQSRFERERREESERVVKLTRSMENRIAAFEYENKDLTEKRHKNEAQIQRLSEQLQLSKSDVERLNRETNDRRNELARVDQEGGDKDRVINQLRLKASNLEQEKAVSEAEIRRLNDILEAKIREKDLLEKDLREKVALVHKRETAVRNVSQELAKSYEVIKKFQDNSKNQQEKIGKASGLILEQEKVIRDKDEEMDSLREELKRSADEINAGKINFQELADEKFKLKEDKSDLEKKLSTNDLVIKWLNKELTKAQARDPGLKLGPPPEGISQPLFASTPAAGAPAMKTKENQPGLDEKYLRSKNSSISPITRNLPSNLSKNASGASRGLLRRPPPQSTAATPKQDSIDSVYFPRT